MPTTTADSAPPGGPVTAANWQDPPHSRWGFSNVRKILPTVTVACDPAARRPWPRAPAALGTLCVTAAGTAPVTLDAALEAAAVDGFAVVHRGQLIFERYAGHLGAGQAHIVMSVSKSIVGSLVGILAADGTLDLGRPAGHYVPELRPDGYGSVPLSALLDMRSRVRYSEDYADPEAEFYDFDAACGLRPLRRPEAIRGLHAFLAALPADAADTGEFRYRSPDTDVLGWVVERATGRPLASLLSERLWRPMGAEADADLLVDGVGAPLADGGLCSTLTDLARFGRMQLEDGAVGGRAVVPAAWVAATRDGDRGTFARSALSPLFPRGAYSRQWWAADPEAGLQLALGIHGQLVYIDRPRELVCVQLASQPEPLDGAGLSGALGACAAIARALG